MSRTVPAALLTTLAQPEVQPFYAVEMLFDSGAVRLWTGYGDRTINSETYVGAGTLLNIEGLAEVADLSAKAITISLSGIAGELVSLALQEPYQRRVCRVYFGSIIINTAPKNWILANGFWNDDSIWVDAAEWIDVFNDLEVVEVFSGQINTMPIEDSGETSIIATTIDSKLVETEKASNLRYTSEIQKSRNNQQFAADTFFDYVGAIQDADIIWGRASA
jgi:hypothetical protein